MSETREQYRARLKAEVDRFQRDVIQNVAEAIASARAEGEAAGYQRGLEEAVAIADAESARAADYAARNPGSRIWHEERELVAARIADDIRHLAANPTPAPAAEPAAKEKP